MSKSRPSIRLFQSARIERMSLFAQRNQVFHAVNVGTAGTKTFGLDTRPFKAWYRIYSGHLLGVRDMIDSLPTT